jgi:hypothetical protein
MISLLVYPASLIAVDFDVQPACKRAGYTRIARAKPKVPITRNAQSF